MRSSNHGVFYRFADRIDISADRRQKLAHRQQKSADSRQKTADRRHQSAHRHAKSLSTTESSSRECNIGYNSISLLVYSFS